MIIKKYPTIDVLAFAACILFIIVGSIVSVHRYWQYEVSYVDFGQYDQALYKVSRFEEPVVNHFVHGKINVLGDHATPSIFLISPIYWLTDRQEAILIIQALAAGLSGIFLYSIAKHVLKNKHLAFSILACYFLFIGLQNAVITEFHELTVMTLPLMLTLWAAFKNKPVLYFISLIIMLGFKEITFALGIGIGIALFFLKKEWRWYSIATILLSLLWGLLAFKIIMPYFSGGRYLYAQNLPEGISGKIMALVDDPLKQRTLFFSFLSFSFLPFLAPQFWPAILQDYGPRFMTLYGTTRWTLGMHYNAQSAVLLAISSIFGLKYLLRFKLVKKHTFILSALLILNALILFRFILHGPFMLALNPAFYRHTGEFSFLNDMIKKIPTDASVMTHNNLAPRFTHHKDIQLLTAEYKTVKPDYILIDIRDGQGPNNFLGTKNIENIFDQLVLDTNYAIFYKTNEQFIFKKK